MRLRFSLRWLLFAMFFIAMLTTVSAIAYHQYRQTLTLTYLVRLTSEGTITWGDKVVRIEEIDSKFADAIDVGRTHGWLGVRLMIERFADANDADVATLRSIAEDAGFDRIDDRTVSWPTPSKLLTNSAVERPRDR